MEHIFEGKWTAAYDAGVQGFRQTLEHLCTTKNPAEAAGDIPSGWQTDIGLQRISLCTPIRMNDKRWDTINLTTASLFLGSALTEAGFSVSTGKLMLPAPVVPKGLLTHDMIGFTLFEDIMDAFKEVPSKIVRESGFNGLLAAGGPMVTLNPLQSAYHLPDIHLFIRGEAEQILPGILKAINDNDIDRLLHFQGFLLHWKGQLIISDLGVINRPADFKHFSFNLDFLEKKHLEHGLELNISRGCRRGCIFCSAVQGKCFRSLPETSLKKLLTRVNDKLDSLDISTVRYPHCRSLNINDDDILQAPDYAGRIFKQIKDSGFRLWGIQTSLDSFFDRQGEIARPVLDVVADPQLYMDNNPLLWLGTDAFLKQRGRKLAKLIPDEIKLTELIEALEARKIRNYHYWISSDHDSDWPEFIEEFSLIYRLLKDYSYFGLIGHSPFLVPYSTTPLYRLLDKSETLKARIVYKEILEGECSEFTFPLVERVETGYPHLNRLLRNEKPPGGDGFFDVLKQKDYTAALMTLYSFLKHERLEAESFHRLEAAKRLKECESELEELISSVL